MEYQNKESLMVMKFMYNKIKKEISKSIIQVLKEWGEYEKEDLISLYKYRWEINNSYKALFTK